MESVVENIVIVGAGIAGLATSLALHRLGVRSLVLEYSDSLRVSGFALTTWTNAWKALDALGVGDILRHQHIQLKQNVTTSLSMGQQTSSLCLMAPGKHGDYEVRCVRRQLMIEALAKELPSGTIRFSSKVVAIQDSGFFKILHLADGTTIKTKVLIGCDGINSMVAKWLGFREASFSGRFVIRGDIKLMNNHGLQHNFMHFFGKGFRFGILPCDDKTVYWFFTWTPTIEEKELVNNPEKMKQLVLNKFEKMPSDVKCFIEKTRAEDILTSPLRYRRHWELVLGNISKGNVCRYLAQAFSRTKHAKEIEEKGEIEEQYKKIEASLRKYARDRRWRNIDISVTSFVLGLFLQGDLKLVAYVRDKVLPHFLAELLLKKSDFDCGKLNTSDEVGMI
ncbi:hypothetical protein ACSQ67_013571 [Phaseolus vulgaris]